MIAAGGVPVIIGRHQKRVDDACVALGRPAIGFVADVSSMTDIDALYIPIVTEVDGGLVLAS